MTTIYDMRRVRRIRKTFVAALQEAEADCARRQDLVCWTCNILRIASDEFEASNHGSKVLDDVFTRNLFVDPKRKSPDDAQMEVRLLLFLAREGNRHWRMISGMVDESADAVLDRFRAAGVEPTVALELFLRNFHRVKERSDWQELAV